MTTNKKEKTLGLPDTDEIKTAYQTARYRKTFWETVRSTVFMLIVVAAFAVLAAVLFLPERPRRGRPSDLRTGRRVHLRRVRRPLRRNPGRRETEGRTRPGDGGL